MKLLIIVFLLVAPAMVEARSESKPIAYARESVWSTAVRFLAVDERAKIGEKDVDAGYVMFELPDDGKLYRGSLEIVPLVIDGNPNVKIVITIVDRPPWMEHAMLKRLERKLRADLGSPNPPKPKPPKEEPKKDDKPAEKDPPKQPPIARDP